TPRTGYIRTVVIHVGVVDDRRTVINVHAVTVWCIVTINPRTSNVTLRYKYPMCGRDDHIYRDTHARAQWSPAIVTTTATPVNPGRSPLVTGYPRPAVIVGIVPSAIVKRRPSPIVIRNPRVTIGSHHPVATGRIGLEISTGIRQPDITIFRVVDPFTVR